MLGSNFIRALPPWASTRLISSTKSGASLIIIANANGLLPETKLNVSSTPGGSAGAARFGLRLRGPPEPPSERRPPPGGADPRCGGGGGKDEWRRFGPPPRPSLDEPPYMLRDCSDSEGDRTRYGSTSTRCSEKTKNGCLLLFSLF